MITCLKSLLSRLPELLLVVVILLPALLVLFFGAVVAAVVILPYELFISLENFDRAP